MLLDNLYCGNSVRLSIRLSDTLVNNVEMANRMLTVS